MKGFPHPSPLPEEEGEKERLLRILTVTIRFEEVRDKQPFNPDEGPEVAASGLQMSSYGIQRRTRIPRAVRRSDVGARGKPSPRGYRP